ncbi:MAG: hypothetical protein JNK05_01860 [Myxococcales bacterium]|nr:hypothetical protein [Myxococcales bacterium]
MDNKEGEVSRSTGKNSNDHWWSSLAPTENALAHARADAEGVQRAIGGEFERLEVVVAQREARIETLERDAAHAREAQARHAIERDTARAEVEELRRERDALLTAATTALRALLGERAKLALRIAEQEGACRAALESLAAKLPG